MARFLIDTDALIDYLNERPEATILLETLAASGETLCLCDIVIAEIYSGLGSRPSAKAVSLLESAEFIVLNADDARQAGIWRYDYARQGRQLSTTDVLVAAAAFKANATIVTANVRDYPMPEVRVLSVRG